MLNNQEQNNFKSLVSGALKILNTRSQDIINRRFGLKTGKIETLESIGKSYGITRERVRQIEESALRELRKNFDSFSLSSYVAKVKDILSKRGNVIREDLLFSEFSGSSNYNKINASLVLSMLMSSVFTRYSENDKYYTIWTLKDPTYINKARLVVEKLEQEFKRRKSPVDENELIEFFNKATQQKADNYNTVFSYLSLSTLFGKNIFNQWGLRNWPEIHPRGIKDKAYLAMQKEGRPLHFREITDLINKCKFDHKKANSQTVHNELIKDSRFVLVGRGIYALAKWGYEAGTVKDVLVNLIKKHGPMSRDKIIAKTTAVRMVKPNTILLNLQNSKLFKRDEKGNYTLVKKV